MHTNRTVIAKKGDNSLQMGTIYSKVDYPGTTYFRRLLCDTPILENKPTPFFNKVAAKGTPT